MDTPAAYTIVRLRTGGVLDYWIVPATADSEPRFLWISQTFEKKRQDFGRKKQGIDHYSW